MDELVDCLLHGLVDWYVFVRCVVLYPVSLRIQPQINLLLPLSNRYGVCAFLAWGAFVGLFLARISRGRTIRQVAVYSFIAPLVYSFIWFCVFGGIGLRQARQAEELQKLGNTTFNDTNYFQVDGNPYCYHVPQEDIEDDEGNVLFTNSLPGVTPVCELNGEDSTQAWFNVMFSFNYNGGDENFAGFGGFMAGLSLIALTIYFVTSSDSGSLIVDHLASNGHEDHHWLQRVFWALTEGAVATALLKAGGGTALGALQAGSIVFGLPFVSISCSQPTTVIVDSCSLASVPRPSRRVYVSLDHLEPVLILHDAFYGANVHCCRRARKGRCRWKVTKS